MLCVFVLLPLSSVQLMLAHDLATAFALDDPLNNSPYTMLVPTNAAIDAMPGGSYWLQYLSRPENRQDVIRIIDNIVLDGFKSPNSMKDGDIFMSVSGKPIRVSVPLASNELRLYFNFARLLQADLMGANGTTVL
jgi:uncharacterized surface protein with fasciclin (FAS1) repeats